MLGFYFYVLLSLLIWNILNHSLVCGCIKCLFGHFLALFCERHNTTISVRDAHSGVGVKTINSTTQHHCFGGNSKNITYRLLDYCHTPAIHCKKKCRKTKIVIDREIAPNKEKRSVENYNDKLPLETKHINVVFDREYYYLHRFIVTIVCILF